MKKIALTRSGYDKLKADLDNLKQVKRKEIANQLEHARLQGDISENAEYEAAKDAQAHLEKRIADLQNTLANACLIDNSEIKSDIVLIGATVTIEDKADQKKLIYTIVSAAEADYNQNKISITSPIGKGLLGHKVGDEIEVRAPRGILRYKVVKIERIDL